MGINPKLLNKANRKKLKDSSPRILLRTQTIGEFGPKMEPLASIITQHYFQTSKGMLAFSLNTLPKSVNHQYGHSGKGVWLVPEVHEFRRKLTEAIGARGTKWKPKGVVAAVIFLESPLWVTQRREVRKMDCDNKVKPIFDAIQEATGAPDEAVWAFHVFKMASKKTRTSVYLFDLGDLINYYL